MDDFKTDLIITGKAMSGTFDSLASVEDKAEAFDRLTTVLDFCISYKKRSAEAVRRRIENPDKRPGAFCTELTCCDLRTTEKELETLILIKDVADTILGFIAVGDQEKADKTRLRESFAKYCRTEHYGSKRILGSLFLWYLSAYQQGEIKLTELRPDIARKIMDRIFGDGNGNDDENEDFKED